MPVSRNTAYVFVAGVLAGLAAYHVAVVVGGQALVDRQLLDEQQARLGMLQQENAELFEELFRPGGDAGSGAVRGDLPYDADADAAAMVREAQLEARAEGRFLMVTFGANWCLDCRTLHHHLTTEPVSSYASGLFRFVNVDVGKFNQNHDVAESLGVSLSRGIPVAVFFDPDGKLIGTTNDGQLEPARHYSSKQILKFVRDVAERRRVLAPDSVH